MRNNHDKKNHKLAKRTFALCLALAVICSCLLPVFATEGSLVASWNEAAASDDGIATQDGGAIAVQPGGVVVGPVVDDTSSSESTASGTESGSKVELPAGATDFVDNGDGTYTYKDAAGNTVKGWFIGKDDKTTWTGDEVQITPNDNLKEDDAAFGVLPIEYHFWLRQLDSFELSNLAWETEVSDYGTETEYLAVFGDSTGFPIWHMDTISSVDTISNYKFDNPTSKDDPAGEGREFAYWYTVDSTGLKHVFDPYQSYGSTTNTVINVYAAWKDASGDVVEEETKTETKTDTAKTSEVSGKAKLLDSDNVELTITAKGLPTTATHLTVSNMGKTSMEQFNNLYTSLGGKLTPFLGFKISPKDAGGNTVEPTDTVTVTISGLGSIGLDALPGLKVLHQTVSHTVETLDASYDAATGTLTFQTTSFSPFVIAYAGEEDEATVLISTQTVAVNGKITVSGSGSGNDRQHKWFVDGTENKTSNATVSLTNTTSQTVTITGKSKGETVVTHKWKKNSDTTWNEESFTVTVVNSINTTGYTAATIFNKLTPNNTVDSKTQNWGAGISGAYVHDLPTTGWVNQWGDNGLIANLLENDKIWSYITLPNNAAWTTLVDSDGKTLHAWDMPLGTQGYNYNNSNKFNKDQTYDIVQQVLRDYTSWIKEQNKWGSDFTLETDDIEHIYLIPVKISKGNTAYWNNGSIKIQDVHIDCEIQVVCKKLYTAEFWVKDPDSDTYHKISTKDYKNDQLIPKLNGDNTINLTKEGYTFDGWYLEDNTGENPGRKVGENEWNYKPGSPELNDRIVRFYGHYTPVTQSLTVSKTVTGPLGDYNKNFTFRLTDKDGKPVTIDRADDTAITTTGNASWLYDDGKFTLKHDASITFNKLPVGTYYVTEVNDSGLENYKTTWTVTKTGDDSSTATVEQNDDRKATVDITSEAKTVAFTNKNELPVDAGVLLDTLPYIVILAVVVGGGALLLMRKRRKDEDD